MFTHIVLFKLSNRSVENIESTKNILMDMIHKVPVLLHLEVGIDVLHSERSYDLALITKFAAREDLQTYNTHPAHEEVIKHMKTVVESSVSVDFE